MSMKISVARVRFCSWFCTAVCSGEADQFQIILEITLNGHVYHTRTHNFMLARLGEGTDPESIYNLCLILKIMLKRCTSESFQTQKTALVLILYKDLKFIAYLL